MILCKKLEWEDEDMFAGVGSYKGLVENVRAGLFQPEVTQDSKKIRSRKINDLRKYYLRLEGKTEEDIEMENIEVSPDDISCPPIPLTGWSREAEENVEAHLGMVCPKLYKNLLARLKPPPFLKQAAMFFDHDNYDWFVEGKVDQSDDEGGEEDLRRDMGSSQSHSNI